MSKHLVTISCENRAYHSWQAKVATYSCMKRQGATPLVVVHGAVEDPLDDGFKSCARAGALVLRSKNYRGEGAAMWSPRNTAASLMDACRAGRMLGAEFIVLMDPDLVWTRKVHWPARLAIDKLCLTGIDDAKGRAVIKAMGIDVAKPGACMWGARVPYVVPIDMADELGEAWWEAMDCFLEHEDRHWSDQMTAFSIAMAKVGTKPARMTFSQTNWHYKGKPRAPLIHYAHPTPYWDKKDYVEQDDLGEDLWNPPDLPVNSIQGWVCREVWLAGKFFDSLKRASCA